MKIIFDATFGAGWVQNLRDFFRSHEFPSPQILHLYDIFNQSEKDEVWIPKLVGEDCLIVTADLGHGKGPRLPALCKVHKRTHILLSPTMHNKVTKFEKARAIVILWHQIVDAMATEPGSRFQIKTNDATYKRFSLVAKG